MNLGPDRTICQGTSTTLDAGAGYSSYLWSTGATTRTIVVGTAGTYWAQGTKYGCQASDTIHVFVMPQPVPTITGPAGVCAGTNGNVYTTESSMSGYIWSVSAGGIITSGSGSSSITVTWNTAGAQTVSVNYTNGSGCTASSPTVKNVTVYARPFPTINGLSSVCEGTSGVTYTTESFMSGYTWSVSAGGTITGGLLTETITVTWNTAGAQTVSVNYTNNNGCTASQPAIKTVTVNPRPVPTLTGPATTCAGTTGQIYTTEALMSGYTWSVSAGGIITSGGTTNTITVSWLSAGSQTVTVNYTTPSGCTALTPTVKDVYVHPLPVVNLGADTAICLGQSVTFDAGACNGCSYQWDDITSGQLNLGNGQTYTTGIAGEYMVTKTDALGCVNRDTVILTVNNQSPVSVTVTPSLNPVCQGNLVQFTATPVNGGSSPSYQWKVNGGNAGTNTSTFTYTPLNNDQVSCVLTSSELYCVTNNPATSNTITMQVNQNNPVSVTVTASANPVCAGTSVQFTAVPGNGGLTPAYQWKVNGMNAGTNSSTFTYTPLNNDQVSCMVTSSLTACVLNNPATSNVISMTVNPNYAVDISIGASANPVCQGTSVEFTATPVNGGSSPSYQWKVNGGNTGSNSSTFTYVPANNDVVSCVLTSSYTVCTSNNPATSNTLTMMVITNLPAEVTISATPNPFCPGNMVNYTATPVNAGSAPGYQWKVNGLNQGSSSPGYSYAPQDGDSIRCIMTSNLSCVLNNPASSNRIVMNALPVPAVMFTLCFDSITTLNAAPVRLKGGVPLGGTYSGPGVNSGTGMFTPSTAGVGIKTITYSYTNVSLCTSLMTKTITVQAAPVFSCGSNLTDIRDNKVYPTVQIGTQCWMRKNLNYGTEIQGTNEQTDNCVNEKYCYGDDGTKCGVYGGLYQWDEVMGYGNTPGSQGLCPPGWHIPTQAEWMTLFNASLTQGLAGKPLQDSIINGFRAIESGVVYSNISWKFQGFATIFWTSNPYSGIKALSHGMNLQNFGVSDYYSNRSNAFAVRCLRD